MASFVWLSLLSIQYIVVINAMRESALYRNAVGDFSVGDFKQSPFHYLWVKKLASSMAADQIDCTFLCVGEPKCHSFNMAAYPDSKGLYLCELLATDKYRAKTKFHANATFHHYSPKSPCESDPCMNGADCVPEYELNTYHCNCKQGFCGTHCEQLRPGVYKNCADVYQCGDKISGVYKINPDGLDEFEVFCDHKTAGGGWTVFQKRQDGSIDFFRGWDDYKRGFGKLSGEFWLGLDKIHRLTVSGSYKLRVDLEDINGTTAFAEYSSFAVANETEKYKLSLKGFSGTAGDSLAYHVGLPFTTKDRDNDENSDNCAFLYKGGWWYKSCYKSNLNGLYIHGKMNNNKGINWYHWQNSWLTVNRSEMKIRPKNF